VLPRPQQLPPTRFLGNAVPSSTSLVPPAHPHARARPAVPPLVSRRERKAVGSL